MKNKLKKILLIAIVSMVFLFATITAYADDPLQVVNNLSSFIFSMIRAIGVIILAFGIVQIGLSLKSHDPSQRAKRIFNLLWRGYYHVCEGNPESHHRGLTEEKQMI